MAERQQRYRDRRLAEGWERVELLVPATAVPWLKAYAHALRASNKLGLLPPRFEGMGAAAPSISTEVKPLSPGLRSAPNDIAIGTSPPPAPYHGQGSADPAEALFNRIGERQQIEAEATARRPDFSKGLLG